MPAKKENIFLKTIKEIFTSAVASNVKETTKDMVHKGQDIVYQTAEMVMQRIFGAVLFGVGAIFISLAIVLLMEQYLELTVGWSFLIIGLVLLVISLFMKNQSKKKKLYEFKR